MKKNLLAASVALSLGIPTVANAYLFDPDGAGPATATNITAFDWQPTNVLVDGGNQAVANFVANATTGTQLDTSFKVWAQGQLVDTLGNRISTKGLCAPGLSTCTGGNYEITFTVGFTERVTAVIPGFPPGPPPATATASFQVVNDGTSFFNMFYDTAKNSNNLAGTGFDDGTLILSAKVDPNTGGSFSAYPTTGQNFDSTPDQNDYPGITAIQTPPSGGQNSDLVLTDLVYDPAFFLELIDDLRLNNLQLSSVFTTVNPSALFDGLAGGGNGATIIPLIGAVNGAPYNGTNPDIQLQTDPNMPITGRVPEPSVISLLGLGLAGLGVVGSRRRRTA
jgi:hypothetical protein